jgi:predicted amidophosphoribosyltransferase
MAKIAREIWKEWSEDQADAVSITAQPICPKCGELGRFSDDYCSKCGTKLLPKAELNIDTGEVIPIE